MPHALLFSFLPGQSCATVGNGSRECREDGAIPCRTLGTGADKPGTVPGVALLFHRHRDRVMFLFHLVRNARSRPLSTVPGIVLREFFFLPVLSTPYEGIAGWCILVSPPFRFRLHSHLFTIRNKINNQPAQHYQHHSQSSPRPAGRGIPIPRSSAQ